MRLFLYHTIRLTISYKLYFELWLVHTWSFAHPSDQRKSVTRFENVHQSNKRWGEKLDIHLLNRQAYTSFNTKFVYFKKAVLHLIQSSALNLLHNNIRIALVKYFMASKVKISFSWKWQFETWTNDLPYNVYHHVSLRNLFLSIKAIC